jgi:peptidoglycan hydrolase-like protein with peptidoglycan-binding domain
VYRADDKPVVLLYGPMPMYRPLTVDLTGPDVRQLERNLWALGYRGFTVDDKYTARTAAAVKTWQTRLGVPVTGTVEPTAVAIAPGAIRVGELKVHVGDAVGGAVLSYTGTTRIVTVDLDVKYQQLVKRGATVTVALPGGETVKGIIARISPVATVTEGRDGSDTKSTIAVVVTVADQRALGTYDTAPVYLELVAEQRKDVLTVPVSALLALAEGGHGVEVVEHGRSRIVRVETGMFSAGKVEIRGEGLDVGTKVGVPT